MSVKFYRKFGVGVALYMNVVNIHNYLNFNPYCAKIFSEI